MSPVTSAVVNAAIVVAALPVALAAGIFVVAAYRLATVKGHSATAVQAVLGAVTFLALGCVPVALVVLVPGLAATVAAAAGFAALLPLAVLAWAAADRGPEVVRHGDPRRRRHPYRRLAVLVGLAAVVVCGLVWTALGPWWALPFLAPAVYPIRTLLAYERRFRAQATDPAAIPDGFALYLRWFGVDQHTAIPPTAADAARLGWVDSSGWVSLERLLSVEFVRRLGGFVALGSPRDVLPPGGATRLYFDRGWREQVTALARRAAVVVMEPGDTRWLAWELGMIRELGLEDRFFIVTAPRRDLRWYHLHRWTGHAVVSVVARLTHSTPPAWRAFGARLRSAGFEPLPDDPGPGCVLAVDGSRIVLLSAGLTSSAELVGTILDHAPAWS
ncbi:hypothetical protein BJY16_005283 [Actinoplanes octamycinicus]|uniref:Uncharacterized protein n=2 Tax=Actinoplanes octamycinicus TaxID=135948 RepID=A0A7W7H0Y5_9ACTN|nr:hypothetical protein [Actinoplanes octamycinicus]MBB4741824.1 hypothetical protein [Actinoplanes octamycinicus]